MHFKSQLSHLFLILKMAFFLSLWVSLSLSLIEFNFYFIVKFPNIDFRNLKGSIIQFMKISRKLFFISCTYNKIFYFLYLCIYTYFKIIKKLNFIHILQDDLLHSSTKYELFLSEVWLVIFSRFCYAEYESGGLSRQNFEKIEVKCAKKGFWLYLLRDYV